MTRTAKSNLFARIKNEFDALGIRGFTARSSIGNHMKIPTSWNPIHYEFLPRRDGGYWLDICLHFEFDRHTTNRWLNFLRSRLPPTAFEIHRWSTQDNWGEVRTRVRLVEPIDEAIVASESAHRMRDLINSTWPLIEPFVLRKATPA